MRPDYFSTACLKSYIFCREALQRQTYSFNQEGYSHSTSIAIARRCFGTTLAFFSYFFWLALIAKFFDLLSTSALTNFKPSFSDLSFFGVSVSTEQWNLICLACYHFQDVLLRATKTTFASILKNADRLFRFSHQFYINPVGVHITAQKNICDDCWWNETTNVALCLWSRWKGHLGLAGSIRRVYVIRHIVSPDIGVSCVDRPPFTTWPNPSNPSCTTTWYGF